MSTTVHEKGKEQVNAELQACKRELENEKTANNYRWMGYVIGFMASFLLSFVLLARLMA